MIHLRTLGALDLRDAQGAEIRTLLAQRKRIALLVHLALAPGGFRSRDALLGMFWPEADEARGRNALNQVLFQIRRALGSETVLSRGADVGVNLQRLTCDVVTVRAALAAGRWEEALAGYEGELLEAFYVENAPEFERWLERERARLREAAVNAAWALAEEAAARGDPAQAAAAARRATELAPDDEACARRRMELLARLGDRAGALRVHDDLVQRLHTVYELEPDDQTKRLAAAVRQGLIPRQAAVPVPAADETAAERPALKSSADDLPPPPASAGSEPPRPRRGVRRWAAAALVVPALLGTGWAAWHNRPVRRPGGAALVAVLPFRVGGADASLAYLREGMVDLLAADLTGEGGPRAVEPRTLLRAWHQAGGTAVDDLPEAEARGVARGLTAGQMILGEVVGTPSRLVLSASLISVTDGRVRARATVSGPADRVPVLVDRIAVELLALQADEPRHRLASLAGTPLSALRPYLQGQAAYRRGRYLDAVRAYQTALDADSTLAPAALGLVTASLWMLENVDQAGVRARAWSLRDRLAPADRAYLRALLGPAYPDPSPVPERISAWETAVAADPSRPESWYELGDLLFHWGGAMGVDGAASRARGAFARAAALQPGYAAAQGHLAEEALRAGDTRRAERLIQGYLARDSVGEVADYLRWRRALLRGGGRSVIDDAGADRMGELGLLRVTNMAQLEGIGMADGRRALAAMRRRTNLVLAPGAQDAASFLHAMNAGRLGEAAALRSRLGEDSLRTAARLVMEGMYWDGDRAEARAALPVLEALLGTRPAVERPARAAQLQAACVLGQWRLWHGATSDAERILALLHAASTKQDDALTVKTARLCERLLLAMRSHAQHLPDAVARTDALEEAAVLLPAEAWHGFAMDLALARLREAQGDLPGAVRAVAAERAPYDHWYGLHRLSTRLREEGRLAARVGDRGRAIRAWRHYLALHSRADDRFDRMDAHVRAELARLEGR